MPTTHPKKSTQLAIVVSDQSHTALPHSESGSAAALVLSVRTQQMWIAEGPSMWKPTSTQAEAK